LLLALCATTAFADEGMWMPQQIPKLAAQLKKEGLKIDPSRFSDLTGDPMGAVVSLGGCSASFVSQDGLVVTNHHCGFGALQFNSTPQRDLINNGFLARTRDEELPAGPGSRIFVTTKIEDVTKNVTGSLASSLSNIDREKAIDRSVKQLVDECEKPGGVRCRVASFFEGAQYLRTTQMEIRDVRLVYAPALGIGDFGGETDNWMWPRHTGDWSYLRAYVGKDGKPADFSKDNVPYHPKHTIKVSGKGVSPGDFVLVAGYPGRTFRYRTAGEVSNMQQYVYPTTIKYATDLNNILREMGKNNRAVEIANANRIKGNDNVLKNYTGTLTGFENFGIVAQRKTREEALAKYIASHPEAAKYKSVMNDITELNARALAKQQRNTVVGWLARSSPMLGQAVQLYRLSLERPKSDLDREGGYQERDWPRIAEGVNRAQKSLEAQSDRAGLKYFLNESQKLPADQRIAPVDEMIQKAGGVDQFLDQLYANTKIGDLDARKAMMKESAEQLKARNDAMINFAAALTPMLLANEQLDKELGGAMSRVRPMYMEALRTSSGGNLYPDANGTLRITFGQVKGYVPRDGVTYKPQTTVEGIVEKYKPGSEEFDAPKAEIAAIKDKRFGAYVDPQLHEVPVNFLSDVDTTGGNSGSPTLNGNGELCGLLFDGTYESLGSDFVVDPNITRSIHVDAVYMLWVMDAVDGAHNLLKEMGLPVRFPQTKSLGTN
jgi:hypothetical protein